MPRTVFCQKLKKEASGLDKPPYPGDLGQKIFNHISQEVWKQWLQHQTLLINENRLSLADPNTRSFLAKELEAFLFGPGSDKPTGFVPVKHNDS